MNDQTVNPETDRKTKLVVHDDTQFAVYLDTARFEHAYRVANVLASSTMIPKHFQQQPGNCLIALNLAARLKVDPMLVMWKMPIVHDKPGMEGQLVIALVNALKPFQTGIRFEFTGTEAEYTKMACTAWAITKEGDRVEYPLTWEAARKVGNASKNDNWIKLPRLMLMYRAATYLVRGFAPEVLMGLYTKEELDDGLIDVTPQNSAAQNIQEELRQEAAKSAQAFKHTRKTAELIDQAATDSSPPEPEASLADWLEDIASAPTAEGVQHKLVQATEQFKDAPDMLAQLALAAKERRTALADGEGKSPVFLKGKPQTDAAA